MLTVFISSTFLDLKAARNMVTNAAVFCGYEVRGMEQRDTDPLWSLARQHHPERWSVATVTFADIVVVLLGGRYGSRPYGGSGGLFNAYSIVELEVKTARRCGAVILAYEIGPALRKDSDRPVGTGEEHTDSFRAELMRLRLDPKKLNNLRDFDMLARDLRRARRRAQLRKFRYFLLRRKERRTVVENMKRLLAVDCQPPAKV